MALVETVGAEAQEATLADRMFAVISEAIVRGELKPGAKISEPELARRYGISRGPLREAMHRLQERRLVTRTPHFGARVVELSPATLAEIFTVREALEGMAAREAARRITDPEIEHLRGLLRAHEAQFADAGTDSYAQGASDEDFHFAIARFSRNELLISLLCGEYYQLIRLYRSQHKSVAGRARRAFIEHGRIVEALADRDPDLAEMLMRRHVVAARQGMEEAMARSAQAAPARGARGARGRVRPAD
ncbi:GntR family transcriptional regulator [Ancylobacter terrae]|uniref:GntR family transcriptional regulator n=1 Tax=Ancylobacter sp. sgz301288 TaxID=3342077 RepID=UPI0038585565